MNERRIILKPFLWFKSKGWTRSLNCYIHWILNLDPIQELWPKLPLLSMLEAFHMQVICVGKVVAIGTTTWFHNCLVDGIDVDNFITWNYRCVLFLNNWIMFNKNGTLVTIGIAWMSRLLCVLLAPCVPMVGRHTIPTTNCQLEDLDFKFQWVEVPNHLWLQAHSYFAMSPSWQNFQLVTTYDYQWPLSLGIM
jgi:hypothetical protein